MFVAKAACAESEADTLIVYRAFVAVIYANMHTPPRLPHLPGAGTAATIIYG
jgi:hypothetical protein